MRPFNTTSRRLGGSIDQHHVLLSVLCTSDDIGLDVMKRVAIGKPASKAGFSTEEVGNAQFT